MLANFIRQRIRFDRCELAGAFGDIGTDLPLMAGLILTCGMDAAGVLTAMGLMQVATGVFYGIPMPVQPLKAVAALAIAGSLRPAVIAGSSWVVGVTVLLLALTGLLERLQRLIPRPVIRGIQLGLAGKLAQLALARFIPADGVPGVLLAAACAALVVLLRHNRRLPPALPVILLGAVYAWLRRPGGPADGHAAFGFVWPAGIRPTASDLVQGAVLLALPQIPLSLGNSIFATQQLAADLFPDRPVRVRTLGVTYALMNLVAPLLGGIPACHGSGGLAGHYVFGGRTGGTAVLYGLGLLLTGLFFSAGFDQFLRLFPLPVLGVLLGAEAVVLVRLARDAARTPHDLAVALLVGGLAMTVPNGFLIGMVAGVLVAYAPRWRAACAVRVPQPGEDRDA